MRQGMQYTITYTLTNIMKLKTDNKIDFEGLNLHF